MEVFCGCMCAGPMTRGGVWWMLMREWTLGVLDHVGPIEVCRLLLRTPERRTCVAEYTTLVPGRTSVTQSDDYATARSYLAMMSKDASVVWSHCSDGAWVHELCAGRGPGRRTYALFGALLLGLQRLEETGMVAESHGSMLECSWHWKDSLV